MCSIRTHLSEQASWWSIMELELYAFVYCVKKFALYLLGRRFTVRMDHKNSYLTQQFQSWYAGSEFQYQVKHIPGRFNLVADGLTRVSRLEYQNIKPAGRHLYEDDIISRIFHLEGEEIESGYEGIVDDVGNKLSKQDML